MCQLLCGDLELKTEETTLVFQKFPFPQEDREADIKLCINNKCKDRTDTIIKPCNRCKDRMDPE